MEPMSAHVQELMDKVDEHNAKRAYKRRDSVSELLRQSPPLLITIYRQDDTCVKFGFSLRGGSRQNMADPTTDRGQYIRSVDLDSPADMAGLRAGDRILAVGDTPCEGECHFVVRDLIKHSASPLRLLVLRDDTLATSARRKTAIMMMCDAKAVINEQTGMPTVTAEMKGQRMGRTQKCMQQLLSRSSSIDDSDIFSSRSQSPSSPPLEHLSRSPSPPPAATAPVPLMP